MAPRDAAARLPTEPPRRSSPAGRSWRLARHTASRCRKNPSGPWPAPHAYASNRPDSNRSRLAIGIFRGAHKHLKDGRFGVIDWASLSSIFDWGVERLAIKVGQKSNKITSLSGGNQQKILIGRSFALQPNILILNDPARGIDVETKSELYKHFRDFASQGRAVVFMSSELEEFIGLCSRVIVFRHGSIFDSFSEDEIDPVRILEAMFGQTDGKGAHRHRRADRAERMGSRAATFEDQAAFEAEKEKLEAKVRVGHIKIVDFDKEKDMETARSKAKAAAGHVKVAYFDD